MEEGYVPDPDPGTPVRARLRRRRHPLRDHALPGRFGLSRLSGRRWALLGTVLIASVVGPRWIFPPPPAPALMGPSVSAWWLAHVPEDQRFGHTLIYGESCGALGPAQVRTRADALPESLRPVFYDGVGHRLQAAGWTLQDVIAAAPEPLRGPLLDGRFQAVVLASDGQPDSVLPQVAVLQAEMPAQSPYNGVRIGLQRRLGDDLPRALDTAAAYPPDWWPALFEELGWRVGDENLDPSGFLDRVPPQAHCHFVHGVVRGGALAFLEDPLWTRKLTERAGMAAPACWDAAWQGLATGLHLGLGQDPRALSEAVDALFLSVPDSVQAALAAAATTHARGGIWVLPDAAQETP